MSSTNVLRMPYRQWALVFSYVTLFLLGLADNLRGPLFPEALTYFKVDSTHGALIFAISSVFALIATGASRFYLQRYSTLSLLMTAVFLLGVGLAIMGSAKIFFVFLLGSGVFGLSMGFFGVSQNLLVSEAVDEHSQSKALSGLHAMYGFSSFLAPLVAAKSAHFFSLWTSGFFVVSVLSLFIFFVQWLCRPEHTLEVKNQHSQSVQTDEKVEVRPSLIAMIVIGGIFGFYVMAEILVSSRLAQYMRDVFAMDLSASSRYVTGFFLFLLLGRLVFAFKKISFSIRFQMNAALALSALFVTLGLFVSPVFFVLTGLTMAPCYPLCVAYIAQISGVHRRQILTVALGLQSIAVIAMHLGVGFLTDQYGVFYAFSVGIFALVLSILCLNFHPAVTPQKS